MKEYTRENITTDDVRRAVESQGWNLAQGDWDGSDPVKVWIPMSSLGYIGHMGVALNATPLSDILNWLNHDSGYFDPVKLGM